MNEEDQIQIQPYDYVAFVVNSKFAKLTQTSNELLLVAEQLASRQFGYANRFTRRV